MADLARSMVSSPRSPLVLAPLVLLAACSSDFATADGIRPEEPAPSIPTLADGAERTGILTDGISTTADGLTITAHEAVELGMSPGERTLEWRFRTDAPLAWAFSFVPDDAFGRTRLIDETTVAVTLMGDHEINTVLSGLPLALALSTKAVPQTVFEAAVTFTPTAEVDGEGARVPSETAVPVYVGTQEPLGREELLAYRVRLAFGRTPLSLHSSREGACGPLTVAESPRRWSAYFSYDAMATALFSSARQTVLVATYATPEGATIEQRSAALLLSFGVRVSDLRLTGRTIAEVWPDVCDPVVQRCMQRTASRGSDDYSACGSFRQVLRCQRQ
jgi:hypothetical protein